MFAVDLMSHIITFTYWEQYWWKQSACDHSFFAVKEVEGCASLLCRQHFHVDAVSLHKADNSFGELWSYCLVTSADDKNVNLWFEHAKQTKSLVVDVFEVLNVPAHDSPEEKFHNQRRKLQNYWKIVLLGKYCHRSYHHHAVVQPKSHLTKCVDH